MRKLLTTLGLAALVATQGMTAKTAQAEEIGYGRLIVNDFLGDGRDRWRSGSVIGSHVFGPQWTGELPANPGEIFELRIMGQVIAPQSLTAPAAGDRAYAGALSVGLHTHFERNATEFSLGSDLTIIGPQNGLGDFQSWLHDQFGVAGPSNAVLNSQIGNQFTLGAVAEVGRRIALGTNAELRPFAELRLGDENLVRAGFDLTLGTFGQNDLLVRDPITGLRYSTMGSRPQGVSFIVGADTAYVDSSVYLPASGAATLENARHRVRAGFNWQGKSHSVYYGASWLSPEFSGQSEGQVVGAVRVKLDF